MYHKLSSFISTIFLFIVLSLCVLPLNTGIFANAPYEASDVLGQPDFESSDTNGPPIPGTPATYGDTISKINDSLGIALDGVNHRLFVGDADNNRILIYNLDSNNEPLDAIADHVLGQVDKSSASSDPVSAHRFNIPWGLVYWEEEGLLFVGTGISGDHRVLVFDFSSGITDNMDASYVLGQPDFDTTGFDVNQKGFRQPRTMALDKTNARLFVTDSQNNRVLVFDLSGGIVNNMDASYVLGQADYSSYGSDANAKGFYMPHGIVYDDTSGYLFVADSWNNRILVFNVAPGTITNNMDASYVLGQPDFTSVATISPRSAKTLTTPQGLDIDSARNLLFVAEWDRVVIFDLSSLSTYMNASYVLGQPNFTDSVTYDVDQKGFSSVRGLVYDPVNKWLITSEYGVARVLYFDLNIITNYEDAVHVLGQFNYTSNTTGLADVQEVLDPGIPDAPADINASGLHYPTGSVVDETHHRLFVADSGNNRILIFNLDSNNDFVDKVADNVLGQPDFETRANDVTASTLYCWYDYSCGIAYDSINDRLFVTDNGNGRVLIYDTSSIVNGEDAIYVLGQSDFTSRDFDTTQDRFDELSGIAYDSVHQRLFVMDSYANNRIMIFDVTPGSITNGMNAENVLGQPDFTSSDEYSPSANTLYCDYDYVCGLAYDDQNNRLFVGDMGNNRILIFDTATIQNNEDAVNVLCQPNFSSNANDYTQNNCGAVEGLGYDTEHELLFVADTYDNARILIFNTESITNGEDAVGVIGQEDFISTGWHNGITKSSSIYAYYVTNIGVDQGNRLIYWPDSEENRVLVFSFAHLRDLTHTTVVSGSTLNQTMGEGMQGTTTYTLDSGALPLGITFNTQTGILSGLVSNVGTYTFTLSISDDNGIAGTYTDTKTYTLTVVNEAKKPDGQYSTTEAPVCNTPKPVSIPTLFQVDRAYADVTLHFTPTTDNTTYYLISYGVTSDAEGYSVQLDQPSDTSGAISYPIHNLSPNTSYYFKVRNGNNCQPGSWSEIRKDTNHIVKSITTSTGEQQLDTTESTNTNTNSVVKLEDNKPQNMYERKNGQPEQVTHTKSNSKPKPWYQALWEWFKQKVGMN